jgi:hypothetical protein
MNNRMRTWKWPAAYLTVMAMIALAASLGSRYLVGERCEMDGQALPATLRVDVKLANGTTHSFCSIECARRWLSAQKSSVKEAVVRDALTGEPLDAYVAFFVESPIVTNRANGNHVHAFRVRTDAMEHIRRFGGHEIGDPFQTP